MRSYLKARHLPLLTHSSINYKSLYKKVTLDGFNYNVKVIIYVIPVIVICPGYSEVTIYEFGHFKEIKRCQD